MVDHDLYAFFLGVIQFPGRSLEELTGLTSHYLD